MRLVDGQRVFVCPPYYPVSVVFVTRQILGLSQRLLTLKHWKHEMLFRITVFFRVILFMFIFSGYQIVVAEEVNLSMANCLFNSIEEQYPDLFSPTTDIKIGADKEGNPIFGRLYTSNPYQSGLAIYKGFVFYALYEEWKYFAKFGYADEVFTNGACTNSVPTETGKYFSIPEPDSVLDFGTIGVDVSITQNISITNKGNKPLNVGNFSITGIHSKDFTVLTPDFTIAAAVPNQIVKVQCTPSAKGVRTASLQVGTNDPDNLSVSYGLRCEGITIPSCLPDITPPDPNSVGDLGEGYDSDRDKFKPASCLNGNYTEVTGEITSVLDGNKIYSYEELIRDLKIDLTTGMTYKLFNAERKTHFALNTKERKTYFSTVFKFEVTLPNGKFDIDIDDKLNELGRSVYGLSKQQCFRTVCGDRFISQTERGASLYVALQFNFTSEQEKKQFNQTFDMGFGFGKLSANLELAVNSMSEQTKETSRMTIKALQIGGDVAALGNILGGNAEGSIAPALTCSFTSIGDCDRAIQEIIDYTSGSFANGVRNNPATLGYKFAQYEEIGISPKLESKTTPEILEARVRLAQEYATQIQDREQVGFMVKEFSAMLDSSQRRELVKLGNDLDVNIEILRNAAGVCFGDLKSCVSKKEEAFNSLISYNKNLLVVPSPIKVVPKSGEITVGGDIQKRCDLPPNYVLTGIGMDTPNGTTPGNLITVVKLEGRKINSNGTLGTREMFCDIPTRMFLSVPDGSNYIITGFGATVSKNKKRPCRFCSHVTYTWPSALHIWYREFDPVNRQLKGGEPYLESSGGDSLSLRYLPEEHGFDVKNTVVTSVGMGVSSYSLTGLLIKVSTLE